MSNTQRENKKLILPPRKSVATNLTHWILTAPKLRVKGQHLQFFFSLKSILMFAVAQPSLSSEDAKASQSLINDY